MRSVAVVTCPAYPWVGRTQEDENLTIRDIYRKAVEIAISVDWRGPECLDAIFAKAREESSRPDFDADRLWNPYGDSRIAWGDPDTEVRSVIVGIEIHPVHLTMAAAMRQAGQPIDLVLSHHMSCINRGLYYFDDILVTHKLNLAEVGVPRTRTTRLWTRGAGSLPMNGDATPPPRHATWACR